MIKIHIIFYIKIIIIIYLIFLQLQIQNYKKSFIKKKNNLVKLKNDLYKSYIFENIMFKIVLINYSYSFIYNIIKVEYNLGFYYNQNSNKEIYPSHLTLHYKIHIFCHTNQVDNNISIKYIPNIYGNHYKCIEYASIKNKIKFGIIIYKNNKYIEYFYLNLFEESIIEYNNILIINNSEFNPLIQINRFKMKKIDNEMNNKKKQIKRKPIQLKELYFKKPLFIVNSHSVLKENEWKFLNIYNIFFCQCKYTNNFLLNSKCKFKTINQKCKYNLYLNIIDNNRYLFKKTDYLFADFSSVNTAPCDAFLVFKEMIKQNYNVYFMSKREDIYVKYNKINYNYNIYNSTHPVLTSYYINGNFLEKYINIILKLKAVIAGAKIFSINNLFYYIEYITYISLGHGISYLKSFLYKSYYSNNMYNKIVLPPSNIIISNAKKYGWKDNNIIKLGLPRWDFFFFKNEYNFTKRENKIKKNKSIFIMFTWRDIKKNQNISKYYFKNILKLINDKKLNHAIEKNNIKLYFSLHHMLDKYKHLFIINKFINYINQEKIIECLIHSYLIITDFSSIIFDIIVRKRPYIIFIPDSEDSKLNIIYNDNYYNIIKNLKQGKINFENIFFNVEDSVNKVIYYINNNFKLDTNLIKFYEKFNLKGGNNIINFIDFLTKIKSK